MTFSRVTPGSTLHPVFQRQKVTPQDDMNHKKPREAAFSLGHVTLGHSLACLVWKTGKVTARGSHSSAHPVTLRSWALSLEPVFSVSPEGLWDHKEGEDVAKPDSSTFYLLLPVPGAGRGPQSVAAQALQNKAE